VTRVTLAALGVVALALGTPAASAPTWSPITRLSSGDRALGPEFALNSLGNGIVVWDDWVGECTNPAALSCIHIVKATARNASGAWGQPVEISRPGVGSRPQVAINRGGDSAILWIHDIGRDRVVQTTYRKGLNGSFPEPSDISEASLEVRDPAIGVDDAGDVVAAWAERYSPTAGSHFAIRVATRSASTGVWGPAVTLAPPDGNLFAGPSLAVTSTGLAAVTWIQDGFPRASLGDIRLGSWNAPVDLSEGDHDAGPGSPGVAMSDAGDVLVAWPTGLDLRAAYFSHGRAAWDLRGRIGDFRSLDRPSAAIDAAGRALVVWSSPSGVESAVRAPETGTWSPPELISDARDDLDEPVLAVDSRGNAVALWDGSGGGGIQAAMRPGATGAWLPPTRISEDLAASPGVEIDASSTAVAVWWRVSGGPVSAPFFHVETADLTGGGPVLDRLTVPKRALRTGTRAPFSVRAVPWGSAVAGVPKWAFGDGGFATGRIVTHTFARSGQFTISVSATDVKGGTTSLTSRVRVVSTRVRNLRLPSIVGAPRVGRTLTCSRGTWAGSPPITFAYRWRRHGTPIPGASSRRYRLVARDAGSRISCAVTATNEVGSRVAVSLVVRP
jgi:hypothetical protein